MHTLALARKFRRKPNLYNGKLDTLCQPNSYEGMRFHKFKNINLLSRLLQLELWKNLSYLKINLIILTIILTISLTCGLEALDIPLISEAQYVRFLIF